MPRYYSSADYKNTGQLFQILAGLGLLSLGGGAAYGGLKAYQNRFMEATAPDWLRPSKLVKNRSKDKRITIDSDLFSGGDASAKVASYLGDSFRGSFQKKATVGGSLMAAAGKALISASGTTTPPYERTWGDYFAGRDEITPTKQRELHKQGIDIYDYDKLNPSNSTTGQRFQAWLSTAPGMRSAWFLPAATATVLGCGYLGYKGIKYLDKLLGKTKPKMDYSERARQIYEDSAKYLKDTVEGRIPEEKPVKKTAMFKQATPMVSGDGSSSFWGPAALIGIPASLFVARQLRNFGAGINSAKEELADRTHMVRAWQAAAKERQYDYNNFDAELENEDALDPRAKKILRNQQKLFDDTAKDDDNNNQLRYENYVFNQIRNDRNGLT